MQYSLHKKNMIKKAIILSGGLGSRLRPFTNAIPKPLLPVGEKAVLEIQIERLVKYGFEEVILATNYKSDYIKRFFGDGSRYGINLKISVEKEALGTAGPIKFVEYELTDPFLVMNGDILCLENYNDMFDFAVNQNSSLTVGVKEIVLPFAFGNISFKGDYVTKIEEKPDITRYALAGIYVMKPELLKLIPSNTYFGMDQLIGTMLKNEINISKYEIKGYWLDIGNIENYEKAQDEYEQLIDEEE